MIKYLLILLFPFFALGQSMVKEIEGLIKKRDYEKAERVFNKLNNTQPDAIVKLEVLGDAYIEQKNWEEAEFVFKQLVKANNKNANYHYKYGKALGRYALSNNKLFALFSISEVKGEFLIAAKLDATHIDARWALVVFYTELPGIFGGSIKKALSYTEELITISPVDGFLSKGYIYEYDNEIVLAEENYKKAIEVGGSITCYNKMISFYKKNNKPQQAILTIEEAQKKIDINNFNYQLGDISAVSNIELTKGERGLIKYIENYSSEDEVSLKWAYLRLAQIYKNKEDKVNALKWINKSLEIESDFELAITEKKLIVNL